MGLSGSGRGLRERYPGAGPWGRGRAERRLPAEECGSKMATTKRVLYVGEQARALGGVWANRAASGPWCGAGQVSGRGGRRAAV